MVISPENILLVGAILLFLSVLVGKTGAKFGVPALLLFLGVGMLAGSDGFGIYFDSPQIAQFIGTVALCIILFSGGMDTHYREIKPILAPGVTLATLGVLMTTIITGLFIYSLSDLLPGRSHFIVPECPCRKNRSEIWCTGVTIVPRCWNACRFRWFRYLFR